MGEEPSVVSGLIRTLCQIINMTPPSEYEVNQIIEIKLVTVCGGKKKFVQCQFSGHQDVCVAHFRCVYVHFLCVPSNTKQASETTANQMAIASGLESLWHQVLLPGA